MRIDEFKSIRKRSQRIGRSGKRGSYSGRGVKGQKSRAGRRLRPAERDIILRIPKRRGFANRPVMAAATVFNLGDIAKKLKSFAEGKGPLTVDLALLKAAGLVGKRFKGRVKLLGDGEIGFAINATDISVSRSAAAKIKKAGGSIVVRGARG